MNMHHSKQMKQFKKINKLLPAFLQFRFAHRTKHQIVYVFAHRRCTDAENNIYVPRLSCL